MHLMKLNFSDEYVLENERVILRPLLTNDFENLIYFSMHEPELWKYSLMQAIGEVGLKNYLKLAAESTLKALEYPFIVYDKQVGKYAGSTRFYDIQLSQKTLQLGYTWYGKEFQGNGLNKNCKYLLLQFAFEQLEMERVEFRADNSNAKSIAAMNSIGCKVEGVLRSNGYNPEGKRRDSIVLSILKDEWYNEVKPKLKIQCVSLTIKPS